MIKLTSLLSPRLMYEIKKERASEKVIQEGERMDWLKSRRDSLEKEWEDLDSSGTGHTRQIEIQKELDKLNVEFERWNKIYRQLHENNRGNQITDSPEFKRWFGNSKIVDKHGNPLIVYHGTGEHVPITSFKIGTGGSAHGKGIYFTNNLTKAHGYTASYENGHRAGKGGIYPVYLKIEKPASDKELKNASEDYRLYNAFSSREESTRVMELLKNNGYDGIIVRDEYVVFYPTQIKSAIGNAGTFDSNDPDITKENKIQETNKLLMTEASKDEAALDWLKKMVQSGPFRGKVYLAGGAVRDMEMGKTPKDLDVVVVGAGLSGGIDFATWLSKQMGNYKEGSNPVTFPTFGTAKVVLTGQHNGVDLNGMDVEAVASRKEQYTKGTRKPEVAPGTLEDDVFRRDFTVNSLVMDLTTEEVLDLSGKGKDDIKKGIIRTTSDPDIIFGQDALRMFRAIRFATKYNWQLAPEVIEAIKKNLDNLGNTSKERVRDEINKILVTGNPRRGFELLRDTGLLPYVARELQQAVGMIQNKYHSEDVFGHTMSVLSKTNPDLKERLLALFHDIGKVVTRSETPTGVHFYGHEDEGGKIVDRIMRELKYPLELINAVKLGVENHMRFKSGGDDAVKLSDKSLRKFKMEMGETLESVLNLIHADNCCHAPGSEMPNQVANIRKRLAALDVQVKKPQLPINGNDLIAMGIPAGPKIGQILSAITDKWFENPNISREEALEIAKGMV